MQVYYQFPLNTRFIMPQFSNVNGRINFAPWDYTHNGYEKKKIELVKDPNVGWGIGLIWHEVGLAHVSYLIWPAARFVSRSDLIVEINGVRLDQIVQGELDQLMNSGDQMTLILLRDYGVTPRNRS